MTRLQIIYTTNPVSVMKTGIPCAHILTEKPVPACSLFYPVGDLYQPLLLNRPHEFLKWIKPAFFNDFSKLVHAHKGLIQRERYSKWHKPKAIQTYCKLALKNIFHVPKTAKVFSWSKIWSIVKTCCYVITNVYEI